jgi:hypothetical protein
MVTVKSYRPNLFLFILLFYYYIILKLVIDKLIKSDGKNWSKMSFINVEKWVLIKWSKTMLKIVKIGGLKIDPKMVKNWHAMGGSKIIKNRLFWAGGVRGGQFINFLKIPHFLQKLPHFSTPKSTPINGLLKMLFPTNRLYFCSNGGQKMSLFGGSGGGPLGPKIVDTTI